jgi:phage shock protein A
MGLLEQVVLELLLWVVGPLLLIVMAVGPARARRWFGAAWSWVSHARLSPEAILARVVRRHEEHIASLRKALARLEGAETDLSRNIRKSQDNVAAQEAEARAACARDDDLGARAALYKLNLERLAVQSFEEHLSRQREHIAEARRRLYLLELQLRQYEVGRSILLSQLAEARTVEQQYAIANNFDPFSAVANWRQAEGLVQEKALSARAAERVYDDIAEIPLTGLPAQVDPSALDAQLAELKARLGKPPPRHGTGGDGAATARRNGSSLT